MTDIKQTWRNLLRDEPGCSADIARKLVEEFSTDELLAALANHRDRALAEGVVLLVGIAAERHPEEMRRALSLVFDLSAVEDYTRRVTAIASEAQRIASEARDLVRQVIHSIDQLEGRLDAIVAAQDRLERPPAQIARTA